MKVQILLEMETYGAPEWLLQDLRKMQARKAPVVLLKLDREPINTNEMRVQQVYMDGVELETEEQPVNAPIIPLRIYSRRR